MPLRARTSIRHPRSLVGASSLIQRAAKRNSAPSIDALRGVGDDDAIFVDFELYVPIPSHLGHHP
jgi:hypothetical protein